MALGAASLLALAAGCSSSPSPSTSTSTTPKSPGGPVVLAPLATIAASEIIQKQLGITEWKVYYGGPQLVITGFDADGQARKGVEITAFDGGTTSDGYLQLAMLDGSGTTVQRFPTTGAVTGTLTEDQAELVVGAIYDTTMASTGAAATCGSQAIHLAAATGLACLGGNVGIVAGTLGNAAETLGIGDWYSGAGGPGPARVLPSCESFAAALAPCTVDDVGGSALGLRRDQITLTGAQMIANAEQWVAAKLQYCQSAEGQPDGDRSCASTCERTENSAWNPYRSDCSGLVSWAWELPAPGLTTGEFAPYNTSVSYTVGCADLQPGDALNKDSGGHIVLFKEWVTPGSEAVFIEEPGCSVSTPYAHEFTSRVTCNGTDANIAYEGTTFTAIRYKGLHGGSAAPGGSTNPPSSALCGGNNGAAYDYFVSKGLTDTESAAIVGNLIQESSVDPTISQYGGGPGRGIAQWSTGGRWDSDSDDNVLWYATKEGESAESLNLQLQFIWYELSTFPSYGLSSLRSAASLTSATEAFETDFEGCGECDPSNRIAYAQSTLNACGEGASPANGSDAPTPPQVKKMANNQACPSGAQDAGSGGACGLKVNPMNGAVTAGPPGPLDGGMIGSGSRGVVDAGIFKDVAVPPADAASSVSSSATASATASQSASASDIGPASASESGSEGASGSGSQSGSASESSGQSESASESSGVSGSASEASGSSGSASQSSGSASEANESSGGESASSEQASNDSASSGSSGAQDSSSQDGSSGAQDSASQDASSTGAQDSASQDGSSSQDGSASQDGSTTASQDASPSQDGSATASQDGSATDASSQDGSSSDAVRRPPGRRALAPWQRLLGIVR